MVFMVVMAMINDIDIIKLNNDDDDDEYEMTGLRSFAHKLLHWTQNGL